MADNSNRSTSCEMIPGVPTTVTWKLKNWKECSALLVQRARCDVELGGVEGGDSSSSKTTFRFKLKEWVDSDRVYMDDVRKYVTKTSTFHALNLQMLNDLPQNPISFKVRAHDAANRLDTGVLSFTLSDKKELCVDKKFIYGRHQVEGRNVNGATILDKDTPELNIKISVMVLTLKQEGDGKSSQPSVGLDPALTLTRQQRQFNGFADFLEDTHFLDVKLKMSDGVLLPAHRIILARGSSVFMAMLTLDMKESKEGIIDIPDIGSEAMKIILRHIYTGEVEVNLEEDADGELMQQVVYGASKYNLSLLLQHFDKVMIKVVNFGNAWELWKLAKMHNMPRATDDLEKFVKRNCLDIMQKTMAATN